MKILLVSSSSSGSGGGELFFHKLAKCFIERDNFVTIAYSDEKEFDGLAKQASDIGCEVIRFPYIRVYDRQFRSLELLFGGKSSGISKICFDSYDVVHVSQQNIEDGIDLVAALGKICPERLVVTIHIIERLQQFGQRLGYIRQMYSARVYRRLQNKVRFAFVSASAEQLFTELFGTRLHYGRIIYNGAENPSVSLTANIVRKSLGIGATDFVIGSVGRLEEQKNYKLLIRAFAVAKPAISNSRLVLVGDGSQHDELVELANSLGVGNRLTITGWVSEPENFLNIMDVFVLPSWFEGFPFALVEALMARKICLASSIAPHVECLSEECPLLFDTENPIELGNALKRVANEDDNTLTSAKKVINNACSKFSMNTMIDGMIDFYQLRLSNSYPQNEQNIKIVTIWNTYGSYHLARVRALEHVAGVNVVCFSHCASQDDYKFFDLEPRQHRILVQKNASQLYFFESLIATLRALRQERPDLVLTCSYDRPETFAAVIWAKTSGKRVFLMLDNQYDDSPRYFIKELVKRFYLVLFNGFIYGGDTHKDYLHKLGVAKKKEVYGYNCVDNEHIWQTTVALKKLGHRLFADNDYFLCVARMMPKKNLVRMILAYATYVEQIKHIKQPWSLVICGDGSERLRIEETIRDCGVVDQVVLVGSVDVFEQVINYYAFARALVIASHENEQWGLVVNEAMASGLPVLVSNQCGCASSLVKNGENGFAFDGKSVEQLTAHLLWMHNNEEKLQRMGECSKKIIQDFSPDIFASNVLKLYKASIAL